MLCVNFLFLAQAVVSIPMENCTSLCKDEQGVSADIEMSTNDEMDLNFIPSNKTQEVNSIRQVFRIPNSFDLRIESLNVAISTPEPLQQIHNRKISTINIEHTRNCTFCFVVFGINIFFPR